MEKICSAVFRLWNQCLLSCSHLQNWNMISYNMGTWSAANSTKFSYKTSRCELCGIRYTRLPNHWELKYLDVSFVDAGIQVYRVPTSPGKSKWLYKRMEHANKVMERQVKSSQEQETKKHPHLPDQRHLSPPPVHGVSCQKLRNRLKSVYPNIYIMGAAFRLPFNGHQVRHWVETFPQSNIYCLWRATGWTLLKYY